LPYIFIVIAFLLLLLISLLFAIGDILLYYRLLLGYWLLLLGNCFCRLFTEWLLLFCIYVLYLLDGVNYYYSFYLLFNKV
jgi:hypothetical protein